ncbi:MULTISPECIES: hypothetical protein [Bacillales]|uniref:hypothetical protein n=1 Tax=Bacillales TaxID=1385 RepID=UPI0003329837|nr:MULTISPECIES: hypothetical protein [Bacillales]EOR20824.1 hypothetical protein A499_24659 [Niallia nealsonii AAU1]MCM3364803.1 hypothetical protein [Niallia sp. MER TA 168]TQD31980.1 hypothetical protein FKW81_17865 [Rhodobacter capsulatus]
MKNLFFTVGTLFIFGIFILGYSSQANAMTEETNDLEEIDPIVAQDGDEDGINDQSSVNIQIKKVSDNLIVPFGAGQWDYIGKSSFKTVSKTFYSGGGDLLIYINQPYEGPAFKWLYKLVEDDPAIDDTVSNFELPNKGGTYEVKFNVRSFVDGDNKKAELRLQKLTMPTTTVDTEWWD